MTFYRLKGLKLVVLKPECSWSFLGQCSGCWWAGFLCHRVTNSLRPSDAYVVSELTIIGSDNGLSPGQRQAIIWKNAGLLLIELLGTNVSEISIGIQTFSFKKMHLNMSSAKWCPFCLGLNVLTAMILIMYDTGYYILWRRFQLPM